VPVLTGCRATYFTTLVVFLYSTRVWAWAQVFIVGVGGVLACLSLVGVNSGILSLWAAKFVKIVDFVG